MDDNASFGYWLRRRRKAHDLTQAELARRVGCSAGMIRMIEADTRRPSRQIAELLADQLAIPVAERAAFLKVARGELAVHRLAGPPPDATPLPPSDTPTLQTPASPSNNLPVQLTSFIGREQEIADVQRLLSPQSEAPAGVRLLTLTGAGGAGKTRLSLQVAAGLLDASAFPDGVWLVELAPLADPGLVPETVATVLGLREMPGRPIMAVLLEHLRSKRLLIVLDNCEHLVRACAELTETLLRACPFLRVMATSREVLRVAGESVYHVPSLSLPSPNQVSSIGTVTQSEAVQLFIARAKAVLPNFAVTSANASAVARVCRDLDGIPLALELAAARVNVLRVEEIATHFAQRDRFRLLTGGSRTALPRHQTLQALIGWSYDLLLASERLLLQRLAVFVGGWTLEAAEAACTGDGLDRSDILELLTQLANKSLVVVEREPGASARYRLLETIRQYALVKLRASGETDAVWRRLTEYYIELAKVPGSTDPMPADFDLAHRLQPERDNLRAALAWSQSAADMADLGLRLAGAVMVIWIGQGYWNEVRSLLEGALAVAGVEGADYPWARARVLYGLGYVTAFQGDHALGQAHLVQCLKLAREMSDRPMIGWTLTQLAELAIEHGNAAPARLQLEESLALFRELGITEGVAWVLLGLGAVAVMQEDPTRAAALLEEGLALYRKHVIPEEFGLALNRLGHVAQLQGDFDRARRLHEESLARFREYGQPTFSGPLAFLGLGETALAQGEASLATTHFTTALAMWRDRGHLAGMVWCLAGLAGAAALDEELERAAWLWGAAEALRQLIGARHAPAARATRERLIAAAREQLGETEFAAAWAEGQALTVEQAIELALDDQFESRANKVGPP